MAGACTYSGTSRRVLRAHSQGVKDGVYEPQIVLRLLRRDIATGAMGGEIAHDRDAFDRLEGLLCNQVPLARKTRDADRASRSVDLGGRDVCRSEKLTQVRSTAACAARTATDGSVVASAVNSALTPPGSSAGPGWVISASVSEIMRSHSTSNGPAFNRLMGRCESIWRMG